MSDPNIYRGTIEKTGEKVLVWNGTYDMENASMRWYEVNDERDWSDDKFSDFELLSTRQLHLQLAETIRERTTLLSQLREGIEGLVEYTETEAYKRAGFYYDRDDVDALIEKAGGE